MHVESHRIGDRTFQIRTLPFIDQRKAYTRLQRLMSLHGDEVLAETGLGLFMFAGLAGMLKDEDLEFFIDVYGKTTDVSLGGDTTLSLGRDEGRTAVFAGRFEDMFEWLDKCTELNFGAVMKKLSAAREQLESAAAIKRASK